MHLVQVTTQTEDGYLGNNQHMSEPSMYQECVLRQCHVIRRNVLTSGNWEVDNQKVGLTVLISKKFDLDP